MVAGALAAAALVSAASAAANEPDCSVKPIPVGCATAIRFMSPAEAQQSTLSADGSSRSGTWNLSDTGTLETLASPEPAADAARHALAEANSRGLGFHTALPFTVPASPPIASGALKRRRASSQASIGRRNWARAAASFDAYCVWGADIEDIEVSRDQYHMHAKTSMVCGPDLQWFEIDNALQRDGVTLATDEADGRVSGGIATDAWVGCHYAGIHGWVNWSDLWALRDGIVYQGPEGPVAGEGHRCY
jgi:hypothetical protein